MCNARGAERTRVIDTLLAGWLPHLDLWSMQQHRSILDSGFGPGAERKLRAPGVGSRGRRGGIGSIGAAKRLRLTAGRTGQFDRGRLRPRLTAGRTRRRTPRRCIGNPLETQRGAYDTQGAALGWFVAAPAGAMRVDCSRSWAFSDSSDSADHVTTRNEADVLECVICGI